MSIIPLLRRRGPVAAAGGSGIYIADVASLPVAARQQPNWAWYVANVRSAAGNTIFTDPVLGGVFLKGTSRTFPVANSTAYHDYSYGGPQFSKAYGALGLNVTVCFRAAGSGGTGYGLLDLTRGVDPTTALASNWRIPVVQPASDLHHGWSRATAHRLYVVDGVNLRLLDTLNNVELTEGIFPLNLTTHMMGGDGLRWIQVCVDDAYIGMHSFNSGTGEEEGFIRVNVSTGAVVKFTDTQLETVTGGTFNELHISDDGLMGQILSGSNDENCFIELDTGHQTTKGTGIQFTHTSVLGNNTWLAINPGDSALPLQYWTQPEITSDGQAISSPTTIVSGLNAMNTNHTSGYFRRAGALTEQFGLGADTAQYCGFMTGSNKSAIFTASSSSGLLLTHASMSWNGLDSADADSSLVRFTTTGTLPIGLTAGVDYWAVTQSTTTLKVATSRANAAAGTWIAFTDAGSGTHTVHERFIGQYPRFAIRDGRNAEYPAWSVHSGQIYRSTNFFNVLAELGYSSHLRGVNDIWEYSNVGNIEGNVVRSLVKAASVGAMVEGSFFWSSPDLYIWKTGGGAPDGTLGLSGLYLNNNQVSMAKLSGADGIRAVNFSYSTASQYFANPMAQASANGAWVMTNTDHGVPDGATDLLFHALPLVEV